MINIISIPTSQISMLLKGESVTLCKWPAFQFKCIHSLVHDKYKYNAVEIRTCLCLYRFWVKRLSAVRYGNCPNYDGELVPLAPSRAKGRNHFRKRIIFTTDLRISKNRFMDIQKSD